LSVVAVDAFPAFVTLLGLDGQRRRGAGFQTSEADRLAGLLAIAVGAVLDAAQRFVDLGDQFALAVAGAQLQRPVGFRRRPVDQTRKIFRPPLSVYPRPL